MRDITVSKAILIAAIRANRDTHQDTYTRAMEGYHAELIAWFDTNRDRAVAGENYQTFFNEPRPEDHTEDYDTVLAMLDISEDSTIVVSLADFKSYVRDDWGWKQNFLETSSKYGA